MHPKTKISLKTKTFPCSSSPLRNRHHTKLFKTSQMRHCKLFILHLVKRQTFVENYFLRCILESFILRCKNWPCLRLFYARFKLRHENQFKFEANKKSHNNLHKFDIRCWFFHVTANVGFFCEICMPTFFVFLLRVSQKKQSRLTNTNWLQLKIT